MKEDLSNFQSQNTKTVCSISELMALVIITPQLEGKLFANGDLSQWSISLMIEISIAIFLAWFNKFGSDFKDGFEVKKKINNQHPF